MSDVLFRKSDTPNFNKVNKEEEDNCLFVVKLLGKLSQMIFYKKQVDKCVLTSWQGIP